MTDKKHYSRNYFDFYDRVAEKYEFEDDNMWLEEKRQNRITESIRKEYLKIIEVIGEKTGFNTNAPERFYEQAKELSGKLSKAFDAAEEDVERNKELLRQVDWALFTKLDWMEAKDLLNKMRIRQYGIGL